MSDIDEKKPTGKAGKRKRNAEQRNRKSEQKQQPKADLRQAVKAQTEPNVTAAKPLAVAEQTFEAPPVDTTIATEAVAVQGASEPTAAPMMSVEAPPDAVEEVEQQTGVTAATADALPVVSPYVSEPPAAVMASAEPPPVAAPEVHEQTIAPTAPEVFSKTAPVSIVHAPVSLQTIANAYSDYTRKSLEQTQCFIDKLTGVRTLDQIVEAHTEFAKQACETFVAEAQKIQDLHRELARQRFERLEGLMSMGTPASRPM